MKQKITLEIDNQTGVEFEEVAEWRLVRKGDFYVLLDEEGEGLAPNIFKATVNGCFYAPVLTPKIDAELEEAKKLIGKWVKYKDRDIAFKLTDVVRDSYSKEILGVVLNSIDSEKYYFKDLTPFPLPVWRCCESDKPKKEGTRYVRDKENHSIRGVFQYNLKTETWNGMLVLSRLEWLDEGGE